MGAPAEVQPGIPFTEEVIADELPVSCPTPAIVEYDNTNDPEEHLSRFENAALLHRYTDGIKCRVFVTTLAQGNNGLSNCPRRAAMVLFSYTSSQAAGSTERLN
ncbi:UNVERIFIED_CONTAM: hypothetical protein Sradi_7091600 [Sesamum radiatum]|uniref:Uncharacterized protein n=1 Tax=Sesamum radiatum TaxID=300843 RepID=A0AAW2J3C4_SESRA